MTTKLESNVITGSILDGTNAVEIGLAPFRIDFLHKGEVVVSGNRQGLFNFEHHRARRDTDAADMWEENFKSHPDTKPYGPASVGLDVTFVGSEHVYGIPEHASSLALKNTKDTDPYRLYNLDVFEYELDNPMALYGSIPFMVAHSPAITTGFFLLNSAEMWIDVETTTDGVFAGMLRKLQSLFGDQPTPVTHTHWMAESGVIDAFVLLGPAPADVYRQYAALTGAPALPPLFALAFHQCRWNYNDENDVAMVAGKMDEHDIPFDVLWLDIEHTNGKRYFTWDTGKFPTPEKMQTALQVTGRRMVNIVDPHIKRDNGYHIHDEATQLGYYIKNKDGADYDGWCWPGSSSWLDFLKPEIQAWWASQFALDKYKGTTNSLYIWNDMNEPSVFNGPEVTMHKDAKHLGGVEHRDVHNIYGMWQQAATAQGIVQRSGGVERPFVLSRAFFAGSQRYGAIWTGDNKADWGHLAASIPMVLSVGLAGLPFAGADIGGFFGNPDKELQVRWFQIGSFQPFMRAHAHIDTKRREPYLLDEPERGYVRDAIRRRYVYLPLWYTLFHESSKTGLPVMRPLWMEYPQDKTGFAEQEEYLVGSSLLVAPVLRSGANTVEVYFPGNQPWYDVESFKVHFGPTRKTISAPLSKMPVFQRGGSIVPLKTRVRRSSSLAAHDPFTLVVALSNEGTASGSLYVDDYHTFAYVKGQYAVRAFEVTHRGDKKYRFTSSNGDAHGKLSTHTREWIERVRVLGLPAAPVSVTTATGNTLDFSFNEKTGVLDVKKPAGNVLDDVDFTIQL